MLHMANLGCGVPKLGKEGLVVYSEFLAWFDLLMKMMMMMTTTIMMMIMIMIIMTLNLIHVAQLDTNGILNELYTVTLYIQMFYIHIRMDLNENSYSDIYTDLHFTYTQLPIYTNMDI